MNGDDLSFKALQRLLPDRELRFYPAVVSTEADAMAWARSGAPEGSLVVAEHQLSARSRPRRPWRDEPGRSVSFSLILQPKVPPLRGGWLYLVGTAGVADAIGEEATVAWPDEVYVGDELCGMVGVHLEATVRGLEWALLNVMLPRAEPPRAELLARAVTAVEAEYRRPPEELLADWLPRCTTVGRSVRIGLYPIGAGRRTAGRAAGVRPNGALLLESAAGRPEPVKPQDVMSIDGDAEASEALPRG